jgi:malate/lactate dehydrogenase
MHDVALSLPAIVGADGAAEVLAPEMSDDEAERLAASAATLQKARAAL